ncbi:WD40/YVTN/BNR-like repeat-containing protein [Oleomonas cavernae]|nr:YCF48-related protein [Oleomonas cavernae]
MSVLTALARRVSSAALVAATIAVVPVWAQDGQPAAAPPAAEATPPAPAVDAAPPAPAADAAPPASGDGLTSLLNQMGSKGAEDAKPIPSVMEPLSAQTLITAVTKAGPNLVAVGAWGHVLLSPDEGKTWTQIATPVDVSLTSVHFVDEKLGFATGHDAVILRTEDGGQTWALVHFDPAAESPLFDLYMKDATTGFAVGAYSHVVTTADGGKTWTRKDLGDLDFHMNGIAKAPDGRLWIAGEMGHIFVTDATLSQIQDIETPYSGSYWNVLALKDGSILAFGLRGNVWHTTDSGATWSQVPTSTIASLQSGVELRDGRIILVGLEGTVLVSADRGKSFTPVSRKERASLTTAYQTSDGTVLLFGEGGAGATLTN